jgi:hypothetical protein
MNPYSGSVTIGSGPPFVTVFDNQVVDTLRGFVVWNGRPEYSDDDGGTSGVREPARPKGPTRPPLAAALEVP